jgi:hypothetical protein
MINDLAKNKGIIFMVALGNDGLDGISTGLKPGVANNAISVGSFEANKFLNFKAFDTKNPNFVVCKYNISLLLFQ